ncbi:GNAT family N-acetyltransferase [Chitinimonas sp.]|uniref:GNAT family N-acetyltransferase n=1 Tax=Chitinimonas sp. TaxID=1934313 RepID=UPI002F93183D
MTVMRDLPTELLTPRLVLRPPQPGDGEALYEAVAASLPALRAWPSSLAWAQHEQSVQGLEQFARESAANWLLRSELTLLVWAREGGQLVGATGLHALDWTMQRGETGWWGNTTMHGQGKMREAVRAVLDFAFAHCGLRRVSCVTDVRNERSRRLAEAVGLQAEGLLRGYYPEGDGMLYARLAGDEARA